MLQTRLGISKRRNPCCIVGNDNVVSSTVGETNLAVEGLGLPQAANGGSYSNMDSSIGITWKQNRDVKCWAPLQTN